MPAPYDTDTTADELVNDYNHLIKNKVVLTTGVSSGSLGGFFVQSIAKAKPAWLILAARNADKLQQIANDIMTAYPDVKVRKVKVDLGSLESVRNAAAQVNSWDDIPVVDVIVNNAGVMAVDYQLSPEGFESHLATNHLGPFLFTNLIIKKILASKSPRIVVAGKSYNKWFAYGQSKTANILFAMSLAEKLGLKHGLDWDVDMTTGSADKALGNREGWKEFDTKPLERGVATHIYAAFDPALKANNGAYLIDSHVADPLSDTVKPWVTSSFEAERLWRLSEKLVGEEFPY